MQMVMVFINGHAFASSAIFISILAGDVFAEIDTVAFLTLFICAFALNIFTGGVACACFIATVFALIYAGTSARVLIT